MFVRITGRPLAMFSLTLFLLLIIFSFEFSFSEDAPASNCNEKIEIDGIEYQVPQRWCGKKLDYSLLANSKKLSKIPAELSFEKLKIYVTPDTKKALLTMSETAKKDGIMLIADSGFRSLWYQKQIIRRRLEAGENYDKFIRFVAPPGYSEHHTGRAIDFVPSEARFVFSESYKWLKKHAADFGFHETYPEDTTGTTPWESWHWVYQSK